MTATYFVSDLHLDSSHPKITQGFFDFLHTQVRGADALYILGDFFDAWIGDDDDAPLNAQVAAQLYELSQSGTRVFIMHGNRDFLIGESFARKAGAQLLPEGTVIDLYGCPTLLLHGDDLCTEDNEYIAFRQMVRSSAWQSKVLSQPLSVRRELAKGLREKSKEMSSLKAEDIMDVTPGEVIAVMSRANVLRLVHGHTHRPNRHSLEIGNNSAERIVLGDWHNKGWALVADKNSLELKSWDL